MQHLLSWCTFLPLIAAGIALVLPSRARSLIKLVCLVGAGLTFVLASWIGVLFLQGGQAHADEVFTDNVTAVLDEVYAGDDENHPHARARAFLKDLLDNRAGAITPQDSEELARIMIRRGEEIAPLQHYYDKALESALAAQCKTSSSIQFVEFHPWIPTFHINYLMGVDGLSLPLVWLTALLGVLCLAYSWTIDKGTKGYYILFMILETGLIGVFCALDFFLFYVFWEVVLLPMYFLIGIWGGPRRIYAAIKFFIYTLIGSVIMLIVMLAYYYTPTELSTFNVLALTRLADGGTTFGMGFQMAAYVALFIGFAIKIPVFPFHTWLPDAHVEAPTAVSVVLAGVLLKMGGYGIFRFNMGLCPDAATTELVVYGLATLAVINIVYGALCAMAQTDFKSLVAYSSISHMGYVLLGIAALTPAGMQGACLQMFNHGLSSAMLFLLVGVIYDRAHHRNLNNFGGLAVQMPYYTGLATVGFFASLGLPGLNGFISEALVFLGAWGSPEAIGDLPANAVTGTAVTVLPHWFVLLAVPGVVLTAAYILWCVQRVYLGKAKKEEYTTYKDVNLRETFSLAPLAFLCILFGVLPQLILQYIGPAMKAILEQVLT